MEYNEKIREIDRDLFDLMRNKQMSALDALGYANKIVGKINEILESVEDKPTRFSLKKKAERAYLLAAKKVPKEERDGVAFPSNYWRSSAIEEKYFKK